MEAWRYELYARIRYQNSLFHSGRLGMRWGVRNGPPYPLDKKQFSAAEKKAASKTSGKEPESKSKKKKSSGLQKGKNTFTRFSDTEEKEVRTGTYVSSTKNDYHMYKGDAEHGVLGNDAAKDLYEMTIKAHGNVKVADVNVTLNDIMHEIENKRFLFVFKTSGNLQAIDSYNRLKSVGYFDSRKSVNERYDLMLKALSPKDSNEKMEFLTNKQLYGNNIEEYAYNKRKHLAQQIHKEVYKDRDAFSKKYREQGYDAVVDPEDYVYTYENPYIITNPEKFKVISAKKLEKRSKKKRG